MKKYTMTLPRTILFAVLLAGGIYYFGRNGWEGMKTYEIVLSVLLLFILFSLVWIKFLRSTGRKS